MCCIVCQTVMKGTKAWKSALCSECEQSLEISILRQYIQNDLECTHQFALLQYTDIVRQLILGAKVSRNLFTYSFLKTLWRREPTLLMLAKQSDLIVPAPSSLWSRVRGKFDIAYGLAADLSFLSGTPLHVAPFKLHWRWKKQAHQASKIRHYRQQRIQLHRNKLDTLGLNSEGSKKGRVLLIDDILTSGQTMQTLINSYPGCECKIAVLAYASSQDKR